MTLWTIAHQAPLSMGFLKQESWNGLPFSPPRDRLPIPLFLSFTGVSNGKESACSVGDLGLIPGLEDPLEKEMAIHSSILACKIPWTEESGGLQSMGSQVSDTT